MLKCIEFNRFNYCLTAIVFVVKDTPALDKVNTFFNREKTYQIKGDSMNCQTVKAGMECTFMTKKGCGFIGGICKPIIDKCEGCGKIIEYQSAKYCTVYADPFSKWFRGNCPVATHVKLEIQEKVQKINPLKASKRASKKG